MADIRGGVLGTQLALNFALYTGNLPNVPLEDIGGLLSHIIASYPQCIKKDKGYLNNPVV